MKKKYVGISLFIVVILIIAADALYFRKHDNLQNEFISGIAEVRHIDVASKIPGRIDSVYVDEGDYVAKGDILVLIDSKEISAKVEQARGAMLAAQAKLKMAKNGLRPKEQEAAYKSYMQAKAQYDLMEKTFSRVSKLYKDSVVSSQEKDQVEAQFIAAREQMDAAKAKYDLAIEGVRSEEQDAAHSLYYQAQNIYNEAVAYAEEKNIISPIYGEVEKVLADPGEIIATGYPVITIIDTSDVWVIIQVKENSLSQFKKGTIFKGCVPGLNNECFEFFVNHITPMADFATWRPTNQKGEFDIRTFEVQLKPKLKINGLRAGMTVNILLPTNADR
jgi:HlyD family secretion protein